MTKLKKRIRGKTKGRTRIGGQKGKKIVVEKRNAMMHNKRRNIQTEEERN